MAEALYSQAFLMDPSAAERRTQLEVLRSQLDLERSSFISHWRQVADFIYPRRPRWQVTDVNRGDRRNRQIIDNTGTLAARTLRSGMMAGVTSPARPWFRLTTNNRDLDNRADVKRWLYDSASRLEAVYQRSNLYNVLPILYGDMGVFGTGAILMEEDFRQVVRFYSLPLGSYYLGLDHRGKVNVFYREFEMNVRQIVDKFGRQPDGSIDWSHISTNVRSMWEAKRTEAWVIVAHAITPNADWRPMSPLSKHKRFFSTYYERGMSGQHQFAWTDSPDLLLQESGYDYFPVLAPRWETTGEDTYGTSCPGMDALGDCKQLQYGEKLEMQAIELMIKPPTVAPPELKNEEAKVLAGGVTYLSERDGQKGFRPLYQIQFPVEQMARKQSEVRNRIDEAFFKNMFLMLANDERATPPTAEEVRERQQEKLLALGPVLEQLNQDLLDPLIEITFNIMIKQRLLSPMPEAMKASPLGVDYISVLAQAQKLIGVSSIERALNVATTVHALDPSALTRYNFDGMLKDYGEMVSMPPQDVRSDDEVQAIQQHQQQQQQAAAQAQQAPQVAQAAQALSQTNTQAPSALTDLLSQAQAGNILPSR